MSFVSLIWMITYSGNYNGAQSFKDAGKPLICQRRWIEALIKSNEDDSSMNLFRQWFWETVPPCCHIYGCNTMTSTCLRALIKSIKITVHHLRHNLDHHWADLKSRRVFVTKLAGVAQRGPPNSQTGSKTLALGAIMRTQPFLCRSISSCWPK